MVSKLFWRLMRLIQDPQRARRAAQAAHTDSRLSYASAILRSKGNPDSVGLAQEIERGQRRDERSIKDLSVGETGFTTPWALTRAENGDYYLNGTYKLLTEPLGTVQMMIKRTKRGYAVYPPAGEKYERQGTPDNSDWFSIRVFSVR